MGSGSSKEKAPPQKRVVSVDNNKKQPPQNIKSQTVTTNSHNSNSKGNEHVVSNRQEWTSNKNSSAGVKNGNSNNKARQIQSFDSDDSSDDDIDAVLRATKNEYNNKIREQSRFQENNNQVHYPESYAQRLQRQQYRNEPQGIMRQKTIYRNPDEWNMDSVQDVSKHDKVTVCWAFYLRKCIKQAQ